MAKEDGEAQMCFSRSDHTDLLPVKTDRAFQKYSIILRTSTQSTYSPMFIENTHIFIRQLYISKRLSKSKLCTCEVHFIGK